MDQQQNQWQHILSAAELQARHELTRSIDPSFAKADREFYSSRTAAQLRTLAAGAWAANDANGYQMARSHLAVLEAVAP